MSSAHTPRVAFGNAQIAGADRRGWFLGHFIDADSPLSTTAVEVKWGVHAAGEGRTAWSTNHTATTLSILIYGRFRLYFPDRELLLQKEGDYALWLPDTPHTWSAEAASTVLTVRFPSIPGDIIESRGKFTP